MKKTSPRKASKKPAGKSKKRTKQEIPEDRMKRFVWDDSSGLIIEFPEPPTRSEKDKQEEPDRV